MVYLYKKAFQCIRDSVVSKCNCILTSLITQSCERLPLRMERVKRQHEILVFNLNL